jgi:hypothetical protein
MLKRHEVEILLKAGHAKSEVARLAGVSVRSVHRIASEAPVEHSDDARERVERRIGRPNRVENFRKLVLAILEEKAELPSLEILRRVREAGYRGGKTGLYPWSPRCVPRGLSRWSVSKVCRENSVSTTSGKSMWSSSTARSVESASLLPA